MMWPPSLAIAASARGLPGSEVVVLRRVIGASVALLACMCLVAGLLSTPVLGWLLP